MENEDDHDSWRQWFELHGPRLLLCARQWTRSVADAEDVLQDAFIRFWRHQRKLGTEPFGLLLTSLRRSAIDLSRRNSRRGERELHALAGDSDAVDLFEPLAQGDDRRRAIESAVRRLPAEQREVLVLKIWGECTFAEIARRLATSPNTVASRYRYALVSLRKELAGADCHG